jgi:hypothetical protein
MVRSGKCRNSVGRGIMSYNNEVENEISKTRGNRNKTKTEVEQGTN